MNTPRFRFRRNQNSTPKKKVLNFNLIHETPPNIALRSGDEWISSVIFVEQQNAIICASEDESIRMYKFNTNGILCTIFKNHNGSVWGLAQVDDDVVVSISEDDKLLLTWRVSDAHQLAEWVHTEALTAVASLDSAHIIVGDETGGILVLNHNHGISLQLNKKLRNRHSNLIHSITVHNNVFITCSRDKTAIVWDVKSFKPLTTLIHNQWVYSAAIGHKNIIIVTDDKELYVIENAPNFQTLHVLSIHNRALDVQLLDDDTVALACEDGFIDFVSLSQNSFISRCKLGTVDFGPFSVLPNAQIAVGGDEGSFFIFTPPQPVVNAVQSCVARLYPSSPLAIQHRFPLRAAWDSVQAGTLTLHTACATTITPTNCKRSLDEWCVAHNLLMQAIHSGVIPPSRHFNGKQFHWHQVLYHHCSKLAIGEKDIVYLLSLFKQAEDAGVIAAGGAEVFIEIISVRKDIMEDTRLITNAIYKLFLRQAYLDVRLQHVLDYQRAQQLTALINAILGCIPVAGGIATNLISGTAAVLNDLEVYSLVESLMGAGKDFVALGNDFLVDRFVSRSNQLLSIEEWVHIPDEQQNAVREAALNLGLSVEELRERLEQVAKMNKVDPIPKTNVFVKETRNVELIDGERTNTLQLSKVVKSSFAIDEQQVASTSAGSSQESNLATELRGLEIAGVDRAEIQHMNSTDVAATLCAFLVMYNTSNTKRFAQLKDALAKEFLLKSIKGLSFVQPNGAVKRVIAKVSFDVISSLVDEDYSVLLSPLLDDFFARLA